MSIQKKFGTSTATNIKCSIELDKKLAKKGIP